MPRVLLYLLPILALLLLSQQPASGKVLLGPENCIGGAESSLAIASWGESLPSLEDIREEPPEGYDIASDVRDGPNVYAYVKQNPWTSFDPEGLSVGEILSGIGDALGDMGMGLWNSIRHPIDTNLLVVGYKIGSHPIDTIKAAQKGVQDIWNSGTEGKARIMTHVTIAAVSGGSKLAGELGEVTNVESKAAAVAEAADAGGKTVPKPPPLPPPTSAALGASEEAAQAVKACENTCFVAGTAVATCDGEVPIEQLRAGDRVATSDPANQSSDTKVNLADWRKVRFKMLNEECPADMIVMEELCSIEWLKLNGCRTGRWVWIDLDAIDVHGWALIEGIDACPSIRPGIGRVVLGTLTHYNTDLYQLRVKGQVEPVELTGNHRMFSVTQNDWVRTKDLRPGEILKTQTGSVRVMDVRRKEGVFRVYNLEVETQHWYFVSGAKLLTHNGACPGTYRPEGPLPRSPGGHPLPDPDAGGPHTRIGTQEGRKGQYTQAREFDANGKPVKDIDFTDHGRPNEHTNPHEHRYIPNPTGGTKMRGPAEPLTVTPSSPSH